jgi:hypothetical protein
MWSRALFFAGPGAYVVKSGLNFGSYVVNPGLGLGLRSGLWAQSKTQAHVGSGLWGLK